MSEWISVKDKLPELIKDEFGFATSDFVLCANIRARNHMAAPEIWIFYLYQYKEPTPEWKFIGENNPGEVTHWMTLPKPPEKT